MLKELNVLLSTATKQNIPNYIKQYYLEMYPNIISLVKNNTRRPNTLIEDLELTGFNNIQVKLKRENATIICLYVTIKYRGVENDPDILTLIHASNSNYMIDVYNVDIPRGFGVLLDLEYLGPAQKVYEIPEFEDNLEKQYIKLKNSGALKPYSLMLNSFMHILDTGDNYPLYHGGKHTAGILNIKYPITNRLSTSKQFNNYISIILDNSEKWKAYPKRTASVMFSDSSDIASMYGTTIYYIFPPNNAKIGICPWPDFWDVFKYQDSKTYYTLTIHGINNFLQYFSTRVFARNVNLNSYEEFKNDIDQIEKYARKINLETAKIPTTTSNVLRTIMNVTEFKNYSFFDFLEDFIKPNPGGSDFRFNFIATNTNKLIKTYETRFDTFTNYGLYNSVSARHELWTDQPCLIVAQTAAMELTEYIKKYGLGD